MLRIICFHRCTKPNAFFLDVFFNAYTAQPDSKDKQRAPNVLIPTVIAYAGGQMDFKVDMGSEVSSYFLFGSVWRVYRSMVAFHTPDGNQGRLRECLHGYLW